jgi:hypothetical protein
VSRSDDLDAAVERAVELDDERDDRDRRRLRTTLATANGNCRTLSTLDLAQSLRRSPQWTENLLAESVVLGHVSVAPALCVGFVPSGSGYSGGSGWRRKTARATCDLLM